MIAVSPDPSKYSQACAMNLVCDTVRRHVCTRNIMPIEPVHEEKPTVAL